MSEFQSWLPHLTVVPAGIRGPRGRAKIWGSSDQVLKLEFKVKLERCGQKREGNRTETSQKHLGALPEICGPPSDSWRELHSWAAR